jgi:hypothetical protein
MLILRPTGMQTELITYKSDELGVQFMYPAKYFVAYESSATGERNQHAIVLAEDTPGNRYLFSDSNSATDGPPTITITVYQNNLDNYSARSFIEGNNFSNFKLSNGVTSEVLVGGESGLRYSATGLYENINVVVARPDYVYMFTAFYNSPSDQILADFDVVLNSVVFSNPIIQESVVPTSADNAPPGSIHNLPVPPAVAAVRKYVATRLGVKEGAVIVTTAHEKEWPDACLGLGGSDEMCAQLITRGYEVMTQTASTKMTFRTNMDGSEIRQK